MKKLVTVFERRNYTSNADGSAQFYEMDLTLVDTLGAAKDILWQVFVYDRTTNAKLTITPVHGSDPKRRPASPGGGVGLAAQMLNATLALGAQAVHTTSGPFLARMELTLKVEGSGALEGVECAVFATLTYT